VSFVESTASPAYEKSPLAGTPGSAKRADDSRGCCDVEPFASFRDVLSVVTPFGTFTRTSHRPYTYVVVVCGTVLHPVEIWRF